MIPKQAQDELAHRAVSSYGQKKIWMGKNGFIDTAGRRQDGNCSIRDGLQAESRPDGP